MAGSYLRAVINSIINSSWVVCHSFTFMRIDGFYFHTPWIALPAEHLGYARIIYSRPYRKKQSLRYVRQFQKIPEIHLSF